MSLNSSARTCPFGSRLRPSCNKSVNSKRKEGRIQISDDEVVDYSDYDEHD